MRTTITKLIALSLFACTVIFALANSASAQGPEGRNFGFGLVLGDPTGGTIKYWTASAQALVASIGGDYFGSTRLDIDYHWHFNAFRSSVVKLYAGPGIAFGFGSGRSFLWYKKGHEYYFIRDDGSTGIGARILLGLNIIPRNTPIELYLEAGPLIGLSPAFGTSMDVAVGIRFYP
jgi:hypothetical protein